MQNEHTGRATLTVVEAAQRLGIGRNQAYEAARAGQIPSIKSASGCWCRKSLSKSC